MDINLLTLNVGNSHVGIGLFAGGELLKVERIPHVEKGRWEEVIGAGWERIAGGGRPAIAGASVNPKVKDELEQFVMEKTAQKTQWVGRELDWPIGVLTEAPNETGADRIVNVAAAFEQLERACVVVDAGTAVTVDFCNDNGDFVGGVIAPGVRMMLDAMHEKTAKLPRIEFEIPTAAVGTSTAKAMCAGVYHGIRGLVKEVVESYALEIGRWPELIATGGDARVLFEGWELVHAVSPDLTHYGIALAYAEHHIRHDT